MVSTRHFIQRTRRGWGGGGGKEERERERENLLHKDKHLSRMPMGQPVLDEGGGREGWRERETDYTRMNI